MNPYSELGLAPTATQDEIYAAYKRRAKETHPDAGGSPEAFAIVNTAYMVLRSPERRSHYDRTGDTDEPKQEAHVGLLCDLCNELLADCANPWERDLKTVLCTELKTRLRRVEKGFAEITAEEAKLTKTLGRWKRVGDGANFMEGLILNRLSLVEKARANAQQDHKVLTEALALLDEFVFAFDAPHPQNSFVQNYTDNARKGNL